MKENLNSFDDENTSFDSISEESSIQEEAINSINNFQNTPEEKVFLSLNDPNYCNINIIKKKYFF